MSQTQQVPGSLISGGNIVDMDPVRLAVNSGSAAHHRPQAAFLQIGQDLLIHLLFKIKHAYWMVFAYEITDQLRVVRIIAQQSQRIVSCQFLIQQFSQRLAVKVKAQMRQQNQYHPLLALPQNRSASQCQQSLLDSIRQCGAYTFRSIGVTGNGSR